MEKPPWPRIFFGGDHSHGGLEIGRRIPAITDLRDRWGIEQNDHNLKEVQGIERGQLSRVWSNVGALNLSLWVYTRIEVRAWGPGRGILARPGRPTLG